MRKKPPPRQDSTSSSGSSDYDVPSQPKASKYAGKLQKPADASSVVTPASVNPKPATPGPAPPSAADFKTTPLLQQADLDEQFERTNAVKGLKLKSPPAGPSPPAHGAHGAKASAHKASVASSGIGSNSDSDDDDEIHDLSSEDSDEDGDGAVDDFLASSSDESPAKAPPPSKPPMAGTKSTQASTRAKPGSRVKMSTVDSGMGSPVAGRPLPAPSKASMSKASVGSEAGDAERLALTTGELFEGGDSGSSGASAAGGADTAYLDDSEVGKEWEHLKTLRIVFNRAGLDDDQQRRFLAALKRKEFQLGDYVVRQGDPGDEFYIITEGEVAVTKTLPIDPATGKASTSTGGLPIVDGEMVITHLYEGHFFGETSLVTEQPRNANVKVVSALCAVMAMSKDDFNPFLQQDAKFKELITELVRKKEETAKRRAEMLAASGGQNIAPEQMKNEVKISIVTKKGKTANGKALINGYVLMQKLGAGSYGTVYLAMSLANGKKYAIKVVSRTLLKKKQRLGGKAAGLADEEVLREVAVMKRLNHANLTALFEVLDDPGGDKFYLVQEFLELGAVMTESEYNQPLESEVARGYLRDILAGLEYLHFQGVVHRDLKPSNILISGDGTAKVADFGAAAILPNPDDDRLTEVKGTPAFQPPEVFLLDSSSADTYHGFAMDVWSLGATLHCMVVGVPPYMAATEWELVEKLKTEEFRLSTAVALDPHLRNLLLRCLTKDPAKRITLKEMLHHPWVTDEGSKPLLSKSYTRLNLHETKATVAGKAAAAGEAGDTPRDTTAVPTDKQHGSVPELVTAGLQGMTGSMPPTGRSSSRLKAPGASAPGSGPATARSPAASVNFSAVAPMPRIVRPMSADADKNDVGNEKQKAHLRALRLRQHQLLTGHTTLSERERDVLAEQKRIAFHADRAMATVEELFIDSSGVFSEKPMASRGSGLDMSGGGMDNATIASDLSSPSTFASKPTRGASNVHMVAGTKRLKSLGVSSGHLGPRGSAMTMGAPDLEAGADGKVRRNSQGSQLSDLSGVHQVGDAQSSRPSSLPSSSSGGTGSILRSAPSGGNLVGDSAAERGLPGMIRTRSGAGGQGGKALLMSGDRGSQNDDLGDAVDEVSGDDSDSSDERKAARRAKGGVARLETQRTASHGALTRAESAVRVKGGLTRKEDFLMVTAEVDAAEGGGSVVKKVIFRAKGTEGSLSITGGRATMSTSKAGLSGRGKTPQSVAEADSSEEEDAVSSPGSDDFGLGAAGAKSNLPGKASAQGKKAAKKEESSDEEESSDGDDYDGIATVDDMGGGFSTLDSVLAELADQPVGVDGSGPGEQQDMAPLSPEEEKVWYASKSRGFVFTYEKGLVTPEEVARSQDMGDEGADAVPPPPPVMDIPQSKRHSLLATKDKDKEARRRKIAQERAAKKAARAAAGKGGKGGSDSDSGDSSDWSESSSESEIGGLEDTDDLLGEKQHKHHPAGKAGGRTPGFDAVIGGNDSTITRAADLPPTWDAGVYEGRFVCCPVGKNASLRVVYGAADAMGRRATMEDRTVAIPDMTASLSQSASAVNARHVKECPEYAYFAVYDGHNGTTTCEGLAQAMHFRLATALQLLEASEDDTGTPTAASVHPGLSAVDEAAAFSQASMDIDQDFIRETKPGESISGSTAVMLLVSPSKSGGPGLTLTVGNIGDCRAVLCRSGRAVDLSFDHKCTRPDEKARILAAGGSVVKDRLHGILAVSRAFGDAEHKRPLACEIWGKEFSADPLTAEPEITREERQEQDEFVILACDGVWDVLSSAQAVAFVRRRLLVHKDVGKAARELVQKAIDIGTIDNVSCCVVAFGEVIKD